MNGYKIRLTIILLLLAQFLTMSYGRDIDNKFLLSCKNYYIHYTSSLKTMFDFNYHKKVLLAGAGLLPISFFLDHKIQNYIQENPIYPESVSQIGNLYGNPYGYIATSCFITFEGLLLKRDLNRVLSRFTLLVETTLTTATVTAVIKDITHRQRPNRESYKSFPSGHTSGSFGLAATISRLYGWKAGVIAYAMAVFVGTTRINDNKHYLSDVIAGAILGTVIGRSFAKNFNENMIEVVYDPRLKTIYFTHEL